MSVTLSGTVKVEKASENNPTFTITITATPTGGTALSTMIQASATEPGSYEIQNLPPGQCVVTFKANTGLSSDSETVLLGETSANVLDVEMFYASDGEDLGEFSQSESTVAG
jgi:hypothetical protein